MSPISRTSKLICSPLLAMLVALSIYVAASADAEAITPAIIPQPSSLQTGSGHFLLTSETTIDADEAAMPVADLWADLVRRASGLELPVRLLGESHDVESLITFRVDESLKELGEEGYKLTVSPGQAELSACTPIGVFYGCQTIRQLLPAEIEWGQSGELPQMALPCVTIVDSPKYRWRGFMLDSARHFQPLDDIKRLIDLMAFYKMNRLHWRLADDQGWRLEIHSRPELTRVGAFRPNTNALLNFQAKEPSDRYGGYYSQSDVRSLVAYAQQRGVTIVPEIDMPGHCLTTLLAYPGVSCMRQRPTENGNRWIYEDVLCPGKEETFALVGDIMAEVARLFPSPWIHIGGDECPTVRWESCPECRARMADEGITDIRALQTYFFHRIAELPELEGKQLIGWDEILDEGIPESAVVQVYRSLDHAGVGASLGHEVILSPHNYCYLDYGYASTSIEKAYSLPLPSDSEHSVLGVECCQWLGRVSQRYFEQNGVEMPAAGMDYYSFPRAIATAELAWSGDEKRNWDAFRSRLRSHGDRLDRMGVNYYRDPVIWKSMPLGEEYHRIWSDPKVERAIEEGIERHRKSDVVLEVYDADGKPVSGASVEVEQVTHDFLFGANLFPLGQLPTAELNERYEHAFTQLFNSATIPFYWSDLEPSRGCPRYHEGTQAIWRRPPPDRLIAWCKQNGVVPRGHPLLWHAYNPDWLPDDPEQVKKEYVRRFKEIAERYGQDIRQWDGVNEPIDCVKDYQLYTKDLGYVEWALRTQRDIFPKHARLMVNEMPHVCHELNGAHAEQTRYYRLLQRLIDEGVPLDGVGFQFHVMSTYAIAQIRGGALFNPRQLLKVYKLYGQLGLPMQITEITLPTLPDTPNSERIQAELTRDYYRLWFSVPEMEAIIWWNFGDGTALAHEDEWRGGLLDENMTPKPSFEVLDQLINHDWKTRTTLTTDENGTVRFRGFHGRYRITIGSPDIEATRELHVSRGEPTHERLAVW